MSDFVEIGGEIFRKSDVKHAFEIRTGSVVSIDGKALRTSESYESIRDKLLGKPVVDDRREEFVKQLTAHFKNEGLFAAANRIDVFYNSTMLSETEGAG